ncbi:MAG: N-acetyltransferase [Prevotella sp.]|nr:N-acetyltransferase [Prevotella sp.]
MSCRITKVETHKQLRDFVAVPHIIYAGNPYYVPDLDSDVREMLQPKHNAALEFCDILPLVAYDDNDKPVGRILGIINHRANETWKNHCVRFGFIEFIDDKSVSEALLSAVEKWGREHGMDTVQGPMGFTDMDKEGMLVEDFDQISSPVTIYNHAYYPKHLEALGYGKATDWVQITIQVPDSLPERYQRVARFSMKKLELHTVELTKDKLLHGYGRKIFQLINNAYKDIFGYVELSEKQMDEFTKKYLPVLRFDMVQLVENKDNELVGVAVTIPDISKALQRGKGKLLPFGWWHLLKSVKGKGEGKAMMLLVGVRPDYQGLGVNAIFFDRLLSVFKKYGFKEAETGPQLENNQKELSQWQMFNPAFSKRRRCYQKKI